MARTIVLKGGLDGTRNNEGKVLSAFSPGHITMRTSASTDSFQKHTGGKGDFFVAKENWMLGKTIDDAYAVDDWSLNHRPAGGDVCQVRIAAGVSLTKGDKVTHAGDGTVKAAIVSEVLFQSTAASANITNTTSETAFDKSYTIPANSLRVGDQIRVRAKVKTPTTNSTDTLTLKLKLGATVVIATSAVDVANDDVGIIEAVLTIRTIGASGTFVADGKWALGVQDTATFRVDGLESTAIDTTATQAITVTATWSAASESDIVRLDNLSVEAEQTAENEAIAEVFITKDNSAGLTEAFCTVTFI